MKTGHHAIQLHTYGPQPSTCVNLYVCMPSGSVLSVPGVCLPSGCIQYVSACALPVYERLPSVSIVENVWQVMEAWYASCWVIPQLATVCQLCAHQFTQWHACHDQLRYLWPLMCKTYYKHTPKEWNYPNTAEGMDSIQSNGLFHILIREIIWFSHMLMHALLMGTLAVVDE